MSEAAGLDELDYYALLGVEEGSSVDAIRRAFHRFAALHHPDRNRGAAGASEAARIYRRGAEAYRVLTDPAKRADYDAQRELGAVRFSTSAAGGDGAGRAAEGLTPAALRYLREAERYAAEGNLLLARFHLSLAERRGGADPRFEALRAELSRRER